MEEIVLKINSNEVFPKTGRKGVLVLRRLITLTLIRSRLSPAKLGQSKRLVPPGFDLWTSRTPSTWPGMPSQPVTHLYLRVVT